MPTKRRRAITEFRELLSAGQYRPQQKFIDDVLRGILLSGDTRMSNWGRALREKKSLQVVENRLSQNMSSPRMEDRRLHECALGISTELVAKNCVAISVDGSDIAKKYGKKMPWLYKVKDGSESTPDQTVVKPGWPILRADGFDEAGRHIPVDIKIYSTIQPGYISENDEVISFVSAIAKNVPASMPFIFDRGHDNHIQRRAFWDMGLQTVVALNLTATKGKRKIEVDGVPWQLRRFVDSLAPKAVYRPDPKRGKAELTWASGVRFDGDPRGVYSIVQSTFENGNAVTLLTSKKVETLEQARKIADLYAKRWSVESGNRVIKERLGIERLQVYSCWAAVQRIVFLTHCAFLLMAWLVHNVKSVVKVVTEQVVFRPTKIRYPFYMLQQGFDRVIRKYG